jgi:sugar phosphate isomerase/epimerase
MRIGLFTDGLMHLSFEDALRTAVHFGVQAIEIGTGNFSPAPHCDLSRLLASEVSRTAFLDTISAHELQWQSASSQYAGCFAGR